MKSNCITLLAVLVCNLALGQTNYPPDTAPWTTYPTNWVYDCSFLGYLNVNPSASPLPCGYYDEPIFPTSTNATENLNPWELTVYIQNATNFVLYVPYVGFQGYVGIQLMVTNEVPGTTYTILWTTNLASNFTAAVTYSSTGNADVVPFVIDYFGSYLVPNAFFKVYGQQSAPLTNSLVNLERYYFDKPYSDFRRPASWVFFSFLQWSSLFSFSKEIHDS